MQPAEVHGAPKRPQRCCWPLALVLGAVLWGACERGTAPEAAAPGNGQRSEDAESAMPAPPGGQAAPPRVTVVTLQPQRIQLTEELPGRVSAWQIAEVRPQVSGIVRERLFTEGGQVEEGEALYQLEDDTYVAQVQSARAAVTRAQSALNVARQNAERSQMLFEGGAVAAQVHDTTMASQQLAQAELAAARAALAGAEVTLGHARIVAPIAGRIGRSTVTEGGLVTANQPDPLTTIQAMDPVYVDVQRSAGELLELRRAVSEGSLSRDDEAPVDILLEDGTRYPHQGRLRFAEATVDPSTGSVLVRIAVENPDAVLLPGMFVRASLGAGVVEEGLLVPQQGVTRDPQGVATALVVEDDGKVAVRQLETARTVGSDWLVRSGLQAGDRVIVEGGQKVQPGMPVRATEAAPRPEGVGGAGTPAPAATEGADAPDAGASEPGAAPDAPAPPPGR